MNSFDFENEIDICADINIDWVKFRNKTILITGATGLVGKYLISTLLKRNINYNCGIKIIAVGRNEEKFSQRFQDVEGTDSIIFLKQDVCSPFDVKCHVDYIVHMASNTHPRLYATDPIGTEMANILGTYNLLKLAAKNPGCRFLLTSSGDIYGDNRSDKEYLSEQDCGYIDCNTLRAGYIEGKRASEALCNAFHESMNVDFVIARLCRIYGSTMTAEDSKAISQFIRNAAASENIVLKSEGKQVFSYLYIFDVVTALLRIMTDGVSGNAYNVAENSQILSLRQLAEMLAIIGNSKVIIQAPDKIEAKGASSFKDVRLDGSKLKALGWTPAVPFVEGLQWTVSYQKTRMIRSVNKAILPKQQKN